MKRRYNPRLLRSRRTYTVKEISELLDIHIRTIQVWIKEGLIVLNPNSSPYLILGEDIRQFLKEKKKKNKHKLEFGEFYCTKCRNKTNSTPEKFFIDFTNKNLGKNYKQVIIKGNCEICNNALFRFSSDRIIDEMYKKGNLVTKHNKVLIRYVNHSINTDIQEEGKCQK